MPHNKGMDWIRLPKRLAIYHRDGFDCIWCRSVFPIDEMGYGLQLDHVYFRAGNEASDLVTCCPNCNSAKQQMSLVKWLERLSFETGEAVQDIAYRMMVALDTPLNMREGRRLAELRRPKSAKGKKKKRHLKVVEG
ncbi:MAG: HNH endonuclease [Anaerolineae bacterium]